MNKCLLLVLLIIPTSLVALSTSNRCLKELPKNIQFGEIKMSYRVSNACEPIDVNYIISEPKGAFEKIAMCTIKQIPISWNPEIEIEVIPEVESEAMTEDINLLMPDKFHNRGINALNDKGEEVTLTCYFNKNWDLTGRSVKNGLTTNQITDEYIKSLPEQNFESLYEVEITK